MKKMCISTYCEWTSYGSVLQSIGLKKMLDKLGTESFIIKDIPAPVFKEILPIILCKNPKKILLNFLDFLHRKEKKKMYKDCMNFLNENIDIMYYNDYETLKKNFADADYFMSGSDQVWNPLACKKAFFLDFLGEDKKRLSYGVSMGVTKVPSKNEEEFKRLVREFDEISVREREMVDILSKYTDKEINVHIDPTFLLDKEEWNSYKKKYVLNKPYILVYAIYWNKKLNKELKKLHKNSGYDIVSLCPNGVSVVCSNKTLYDVGVGEFLYLIDNAEAVVSSSFHGVALSLNFNKKVAVVINPDAPSRLSSLLDVLGYLNPKIEDVLNVDETMFDQVNKNIKSEREKSVNYLRRILEINE